MNTTPIYGTSNTTSHMTASIIPDKVDPAAANMPLKLIEKTPESPRIHTVAKHHENLAGLSVKGTENEDTFPAPDTWDYRLRTAFSDDTTDNGRQVLLSLVLKKDEIGRV